MAISCNGRPFIRAVDGRNDLVMQRDPGSSDGLSLTAGESELIKGESLA